MATSVKAAGTQVIGKAFIVYGTVKAIAPDGTVRVLGPNSEIYADERIVTESDGGVSLMLDGPPPSQIDIGRMSDVLMNEDVYAGGSAEAVTDSSADAEKIQEALEGKGDIELDATAAGGAAGTGSATLVQFGLDGAEGNVTSGAETTGFTQGTVEPLDAILAADDTPTGGIDVAAVDEDGLPYNWITGSVGVGDAADGDHPAVLRSFEGNLTYTFGNDGQAAVNPFVWGTDGLAEKGVTSQGHELLYEVSEDGLTLTAYYEGERGISQISDNINVQELPELDSGRVIVFTATVTDVTAGTYTFTLYQPLDHAVAGTEDDILYNFTYTLTDGNGTMGTGSLGMTIDDDMPTIGEIPDGVVDESGDSVETSGEITAMISSQFLGLGSSEGSFTLSFGADGPAWSFNEETGYTFDGFVLSAEGKWSGAEWNPLNSTLSWTAEGDTDASWTISVWPTGFDPDTGQSNVAYNFTLLKALDHLGSEDESLDIQFTATVKGF